jgi:hypothetical protein
MGKIIDFTGTTTGPVPVDKVCDGARELDDVLIIGWRGDDFYMAQSDSSIADALLLIEIAKAYLMQMVLHGE